MSRFRDVLGIDGNTVDQSRLEEYIQFNHASRYDQELDKRDASVLAKIAASWWAVLGYCNLDLNKFVEYSCSEIDSFEKAGTDDATESRKKKITSLTIRNTSKNYDHPGNIYHLLKRLSDLRELTIHGLLHFGRLHKSLPGLSNLRSLCVTIPQQCITNPFEYVHRHKSFASAVNVKLETLKFLGHMPLDEKALEDFFFKILPLFPKLSSFSVENNNVQSFQKIAQRLLQEQNEIQINSHSYRLREIDLGVCNYNTDDDDADDNGNKARGLLRDNELEIKAVTTILETYLGLVIKRRWRWNGGTGLSFGGVCPMHPTLEYLSEMNQAGRVLLVRRSTRRDDHSHKNTTTSSFEVPLSVWPLVLARAGKVRRRANLTFSPSPNAVYYFFRNAPELYPRSTIQRPMSVAIDEQDRNLNTSQNYATVNDIENQYPSASQCIVDEPDKNLSTIQSNATVIDIENEYPSASQGMVDNQDQNPLTSHLIDLIVDDIENRYLPLIECSVLTIVDNEPDQGGIDPTNKDVLMGHSRKLRKHSGNVHFAELCASYHTSLKGGRVNITGKVTDIIKRSGGRFLEFVNGQWVVVTNQLEIWDKLHSTYSTGRVLLPPSKVKGVYC